MNELELYGAEQVYLAVLLKQCLKQNDATAWVCANDRLALETIDFLTWNKIPVPGQISVMGFDDTVEAYNKNLTTYNFHLEEAAYKMISYILNPRQVGRELKWNTEIEGAVVPRGSTAERNGNT
jgi:DNA-binding LacI/PurR family transcriptional regulator